MWSRISSRAIHTNQRLRTGQSAVAATQPHAPPPATAQHLKHPSAIGHPALRKEPVKAGSDKGFFVTFIGLLAAGVPLTYWYWGYRADHMRRVKEEKLKEVQERYRAGG